MVTTNMVLVLVVVLITADVSRIKNRKLSQMLVFINGFTTATLLNIIKNS